MSKFRLFKFVGIAFTLWLMATLGIACQPITREGANTVGPSAEEEVLAAAMGLEEAYQENDLERTLSYYADDAISQPPGFRTDVGKAAIRTSYEAFFADYEMKRDFELADLKIDGNTATRFGEWRQVLTPKAGGEPITEVGRCIVGFEKIDGEWKVTWEIWNTYEPEE